LPRHHHLRDRKVLRRHHLRDRKALRRHRRGMRVLHRHHEMQVILHRRKRVLNPHDRTARLRTMVKRHETARLRTRVNRHDKMVRCCTRVNFRDKRVRLHYRRGCLDRKEQILQRMVRSFGTKVVQQPWAAHWAAASPRIRHDTTATNSAGVHIRHSQQIRSDHFGSPV
jgi:hypothetical protein